MKSILDRIKILSGLDLDGEIDDKNEGRESLIDMGLGGEDEQQDVEMETIPPSNEQSFKERLLERLRMSKCVDFMDLSELNASLSLPELQMIYVKECLATIHSLDNTLKSIETSNTGADSCLLGTRDKKAIEAVLETIVAWGILSFLDSSAIQSILGSSVLALPLVNSSSFNAGDKINYLNQCLEQLVKLCAPSATGPTEVGNLIRRKYFRWILISSLMQIHAQQESSMIQDTRTQIRDVFLDSTDSLTIISTCFSLLGKNSASSIWLRRELGQIMTHTLDRYDGINALFSFILSSEETASESVTDIARMEKVCQVLISVPAGRPKEAYYTQLWSRLVTILQGPASLYPPLHKQASSFCLVSMINKFKKFADARLKATVFYPLLAFYTNERSDNICATEDDIYGAIDAITKLIVGTEPSLNLMNSLNAVIAPLYYIYDFANRSSSGIKKNVHDILSTFFTLSDTDACVSALEKILFDPIKCSKLAQIKPGPTGGVLLLARSNNDDESQEQAYLDLDQFLVFVADISNRDVLPKLFLNVMKMHFSKGGNDEDDTIESDESSQMIQNGSLYVWTSQIIIALMDKFGQSLLRKKGQILAFIKRTLINPSDNDMISMSLSLLQSIVMGQEDGDDALDKLYSEELKEIRIILQSLSMHADEAISSTAQMIRILLKRQDETSQINSGDSKKDKGSSLSTLKQALKDLDDELLPIRAHGISQLKNLVLSKDPLALEYLTTIINIFLDQLHDQDSFIYLNCVKGLSALTDAYPKETLEQIVQRYIDDAAFDMDYRLRIGESLLQTIQRAGEMFPASVGPQLLPKLLRVLKNNAQETKEIKSSAISLLSAVALHSPITLAPSIHQVIDLLVTVLQLEKDVEPRRAAILTMSSLLRGLGSDVFSTLTPSLLKSIHVQLRLIEATDKDPLSRYNARMALLDIRDAFISE